MNLGCRTCQLTAGGLSKQPLAMPVRHGTGIFAGISPHPRSSGGQRMVFDFVQRLEEEVRKLEYELKNELPKEIQRARELGDLSENAEYAAAKERQDYVGALLAKKKKRLADMRMIDLTKIPRGVVGFGSVVLVYDINQDKKVEYFLVASEDADAPNGRVSITSPIGLALMGKVEGDTAEFRTPGGAREMEILKLTTIHDQKT
jgi:transcription elongation factor GreA